MSDRSQRQRRYSSQLRQENAEATRLRIVEAARELMLERGYAATTMSDIAAAAGVAVQTLYTSCPGGKAGLAKVVYDITLAGDAQQIPQRARPEVLAIIAEPEPARKLALYAAMATSIAVRIAPVYRVLRAAAAAAADSGVRALVDETEHQHLVGSRGPAEHLAAVGALRPGLSAERAAEQIYALTSIEIYERLTGICGWKPAEYRDWLTGLLVATLLGESSHDEPAQRLSAH